MNHFILVGAGGALGALARWKLGGLVLHLTADWKFPLGTFVVNVIGCLAAGILAGLAAKHDLFGADARLFLFTGLLGGFTTFSALSLETVGLLRDRNYGTAILYVTLSVFVGIASLWAGLILIRPDDPR